MPKKSQARSVFEKLHAYDQDYVMYKMDKLPSGEPLIPGKISTKQFSDVVREVAGKPGAYTTKPGDMIRNSKLSKKVKTRSF